MSYCTLDDLKTYRKIEDSTQDVLLGSSIERAQAAIDIYCRRTFESYTDETRYLDSVEDVDGATLYVTVAGELAAITTVTNGDASVLALTDFVTEPRTGTPSYALRLLASSGVTWVRKDNGDHENAIAILGRWAYSVQAPDDITQACIRWAAWLFDQKDNAADLDRPVIAGNATILPAQIPSDVFGYLKPYRRLV